MKEREPPGPPDRKGTQPMAETETRIVSTVDEVIFLDWEIPNLGYDGSEPLTDEELDGVIGAFEYYNNVYLEGIARQYFKEAAEPYYKTS